MEREAAIAVAGRLLGRPVRGVEPAGGGGNSRLLKVEAAGGAVYALKLYPPLAADPRDRLGAEAAALRFLAACGVGPVPALLGTDRAANCALLEWVDGGLAEAEVNAPVDAALDFLRALHAARRQPAAAALPPASEACPAAADVVTQVERRMERLRLAAGDHPSLRAFLEDAVLPQLGRWTAAAAAGYAEAGRTMDAAVADPTLSPSDFGFHNALRTPDGRLVFIDFEYFGWDDPVKLVADTLLHPRNHLQGTARRRLTEGLAAIYDEDPFFRRRLALLTPLYGLRWCAILLNEFLPEKWAVRAHAGAAEREAVQARQLTKAQTLFDKVSRSHDEFLPQ